MKRRSSGGWLAGLATCGLVFFGCNGRNGRVDGRAGDGKAGDAVASDGLPKDTGGRDTAGNDRPGHDAGGPDGATADALATGDRRLDGRPLDSAPADAAPACAYFDVLDHVVACGDSYRMIGRFESTPTNSACPPYYQLAGDLGRYPSENEAIASAGCDDKCIWWFAAGVTRLRCGHREGFEVLRASDPSCGELFRFPDGYYHSVEEYDAAHPCP